MGKPNHKGRAKGGFVMVLHSMMESAAWLDLTGVSVKLLLHLIKMSKGNNGFGTDRDRGRLFLSERDAAAAIGVSRNTIARAFEELKKHGFLRAVTRGNFHVKGMATTWRLTFQPFPHAGLPPTNEWHAWRPSEKKEQAQKPTTVGSKTDMPGSNSEPAHEKNGENSLQAIGPTIEPHIQSTMEGAGTGSLQEDRGSKKSSPASLAATPDVDDIRRRLREHKRSHAVGALGILAAEAAISLSVVSSLLNGGKVPSALALLRIADALAKFEAAEREAAPDAPLAGRPIEANNRSAAHV